MTDDERDALAWLDSFELEQNIAHARTLKRMLAQPRLPKEPSEEAIRAMDDAFMMTLDPDRPRTHRMIYRALYAHLTKPRTKTVWTVEDGSGQHQFDALDKAVHEARVSAFHGCRVTIERREVPV